MIPLIIINALDPTCDLNESIPAISITAPTNAMKLYPISAINFRFIISPFILPVLSIDFLISKDQNPESRCTAYYHYCDRNSGNPKIRDRSKPHRDRIYDPHDSVGMIISFNVCEFFAPYCGTGPEKHGFFAPVRIDSDPCECRGASADTQQPNDSADFHAALLLSEYRSHGFSDVFYRDDLQTWEFLDVVPHVCRDHAAL